MSFADQSLLDGEYDQLPGQYAGMNYSKRWPQATQTFPAVMIPELVERLKDDAGKNSPDAYPFVDIKCFDVHNRDVLMVRIGDEARFQIGTPTWNAQHVYPALNGMDPRKTRLRFYGVSWVQAEMNPYGGKADFSAVTQGTVTVLNTGDQEMRAGKAVVWRWPEAIEDPMTKNKHPKFVNIHHNHRRFVPALFAVNTVDSVRAFQVIKIEVAHIASENKKGWKDVLAHLGAANGSLARYSLAARDIEMCPLVAYAYYRFCKERKTPMNSTELDNILAKAMEPVESLTGGPEDAVYRGLNCTEYLKLMATTDPEEFVLALAELQRQFASSRFIGTCKGTAVYPKGVEVEISLTKTFA